MVTEEIKKSASPKDLMIAKIVLEEAIKYGDFSEDENYSMAVVADMLGLIVLMHQENHIEWENTTVKKP